MKPLLLLPFLLAQTPWVPPFKVVETPSEPAKYVAHMKERQEDILLEGDTLTFLYKSKQETVQLFNGLSLKLTKIPESDVWIAQARMPDWNKAFFNYSFVDGGYKGGRVNMKVWRGPDAPTPPKEVQTLQGTVKTYTLKSTSLNEDRMVMVYLPPNAPKGLPAVYLADGGACEGYAKLLEPLILEKKVRPVALIGVYSGAYKGDPNKAPYDPNKDFRAREYLKQADPETYAKHLEFFCGEVVRWATKEFGLSDRREDRAIQGVSNGGAFATTASVDRPKVFAFAMPFSVAAYDRDTLRKEVAGKDLPKYYFAAGTLETFIRGTRDAHAIVSENHAKSVYESYVSGHDAAMWNLAFVKYLPQIFPAK